MEYHQGWNQLNWFWVYCQAQTPNPKSQVHGQYVMFAGVYILSQNFIIAPKRNKRVMKIFIIAPNLHVAQ